MEVLTQFCHFQKFSEKGPDTLKQPPEHPQTHKSKTKILRFFEFSKFSKFSQIWEILKKNDSDTLRVPLPVLGHFLGFFRKPKHLKKTFANFFLDFGPLVG